MQNKLWKAHFYNIWAREKYDEETFQESMWEFMQLYAQDQVEQSATINNLAKIIWKKFKMWIKRDKKDLIGIGHYYINTDYKGKI